MADPEGMKELGGAASAFIGMMGTAIVTLATAVGIQWKQAAKVYGFRLAERDTLKDALNGSTKALEAATRVAEERNRVTEDLADAIRDMAGTFEKLLQRIEFQYDNMRDQQREHHRSMDEQVKAIAGLADALRVNTGIVTDVRNKLMRDGIV